MVFSARETEKEQEDYVDIFARRGREYNRGMRRFPLARAREFKAAIDALQPMKGATILDAPAGGGYLQGFLPRALGATVIEVDPAVEFRCEDNSPGMRNGSAAPEPLIAPLNAIPVETGSCDVAVSVAGLHHATDLEAIFREFRRIIRPGGRLVIMEVEQGSCVDHFLNGFVDEFNSTGHRGEFIDHGFRSCLRRAGFSIETDHVERYTWDFPDRQAMAEFTRLVFGLDLANDVDIVDGIDRTVGFAETGTGCFMNWELRLIAAS